jgi:hypothetical protein
MRTNVIIMLRTNRCRLFHKLEEFVLATSVQATTAHGYLLEIKTEIGTRFKKMVDMFDQAEKDGRIIMEDAQEVRKERTKRDTTKLLAWMGISLPLFSFLLTSSLFLYGFIH